MEWRGRLGDFLIGAIVELDSWCKDLDNTKPSDTLDEYPKLQRSRNRLKIRETFTFMYALDIKKIIIYT